MRENKTGREIIYFKCKWRNSKILALSVAGFHCSNNMKSSFSSSYVFLLLCNFKFIHGSMLTSATRDFFFSSKF